MEDRAESPPDYLSQWYRFPLLSEEEEHALATRYRSGDGSAGELLVAHHMQMVIRLARSRAGRSDLDELVQAGTCGLLEALHSYDPAKGGRFSGWAKRWVVSEINSYLQANISIAGDFRNKRAGRHVFYNLQRARKDLGAGASYEALAAHMQANSRDGINVTREEVVAVAQQMDANALSFSDPVGEAGRRRGETIADTGTLSPDDSADTRLAAAAVAQLLMNFAEGLEGMERAIWCLRLAAERPLTPSEAADRLHMTEDYLNAREEALRRRLRSWLSE